MFWNQAIDHRLDSNRERHELRRHPALAARKPSADPPPLVRTTTPDCARAALPAACAAASKARRRESRKRTAGTGWADHRRRARHPSNGCSPCRRNPDLGHLIEAGPPSPPLGPREGRRGAHLAPTPVTLFFPLSAAAHSRRLTGPEPNPHNLGIVRSAAKRDRVGHLGCCHSRRQPFNSRFLTTPAAMQRLTRTTESSHKEGNLSTTNGKYESHPLFPKRRTRQPTKRSRTDKSKKRRHDCTMAPCQPAMNPNKVSPARTRERPSPIGPANERH